MHKRTAIADHRRAKIVFLTADGRGTAESTLATGKAKAMIWPWQERFQEAGIAVFGATLIG